MSAEKKLFVPSPEYKLYAPDDLGKKWFVYWREEGKRIRKYGSINRQTTAIARRQAAAELIRELKTEQKRSLSKTEQALREYLAERVATLSRKTRSQYTSMANGLFAFLDGREVSEDLIRQYFRQLGGRLHPTTYNKNLTVLKSLFRGIGGDYLFDRIEAKKARSEPDRRFQDHQARRLGRAIEAEDPQLWLFVKFIFYCFIRPGELRLLKAGDILLDSWDIRVSTSTAKNNKTQYVTVPDVFRPDLEFLYELGPDEYLFTNGKGKQLGYNSMYNRHREILRSLRFGVGYTLYSWKHTGAVAMAKAGISLKEIQMQLRHHSLDQTDQYLRQMGVRDIVQLRTNAPRII